MKKPKLLSFIKIKNRKKSLPVFCWKCYNNSMEKIQRDSRFELLRIISMILIIMHHFACHGGYNFDASVSALNKAVVDIFIVGGKIGVNVFLLISGYFMIDKKFKFSKLIKLLLEVFFYSFVIYILFVIFGKTQFNISAFAKNVFPTITKQYWFITYYIILYILSPFINKLINSLHKGELLALVLVLLTFQVIIPMISSNYFSYAGWFITIYLISAYIRLYSNKFFDSFKWNLLLFLGSLLAIILFNVFLGIGLYSINNIVAVICSVSLFCTFKNIKKPIYSKFINIVSSTTLGIYLIHDNNFIRCFLWREVLQCPTKATQNLFLLFAIISCIVVFVVCFAIDLARQYAFEKPIMKLVYKAENSIVEKWKTKRELKQKDNQENVETNVDENSQSKNEKNADEINLSKEEILEQENFNNTENIKSE